ncbi:MAG: nucleoside triphosphate pyrophosphohydrolase [Ignavibacteria bacterium]|nr:nucleoside triphosphate pyrophosphohydrolase [Ignavibacteria bacterium]
MKKLKHKLSADNPVNEFDEFVRIVKRLRNECPWDREQSHESIRHLLLEETYETLEAIDEKNYEALKKELGDLLLHVVFNAVIAEGNGNFTLKEVIESINSKLISRHPHVFGETKVSGKDEVLKNWESLKLKEDGRKSLLDGVPKNLPSLTRAYRIGEKSSKVGFDWENAGDSFRKIEEELKEFRELTESKRKSDGKFSDEDREELEKELGDILFAIVNYSRFLEINPENALRKTIEKYIKRFRYIENELEKAGKNITDSNLQEMDHYWNESKKIYR